MSTIELISTNLDAHPESWCDYVQAFRDTTTSLELVAGGHDQAQKQWQLPVITTFQRVAFADADNGPVQDIADWCLRQALALLQFCPQDVDILACK